MELDENTKQPTQQKVSALLRQHFLADLDWAKEITMVIGKVQAADMRQYTRSSATENYVTEAFFCNKK